MEKFELLAKPLEGKIALVTGGAKGIGEWIALGLASAGADVAVADIDLKGAQETAEEIQKLGRKAMSVRVDISNFNSITEMVQSTIKKFGRIDCLVNDAGVNVHKPFLEITPEEFDFISNVNFRGTYFVSQQVAKEMIKGGGGKIISIASATSLLLRPGIPNSVYAGTKAGIAMLTKAFAEELSSYNINVNAISPGYFATPLTEDRLSDPEVLNTILSFTPLKKVGRANEIIGPVIFLASEASNFITGQNIFVDGGRSIL